MIPPDGPEPIRLSVKPQGTPEDFLEDFPIRGSYSPPFKRRKPHNKLTTHGTYYKELPGLHGVPEISGD